MRGNEFVRRGARSSVGTVTIIPAVAGARHHLTKGMISVYVATGSANLDVIETRTATTTSPGTWFTISASVKGIYNFDLGPRGYAASSVSSRVALSITGSESAVHCLFAGYTR